MLLSTKTVEKPWGQDVLPPPFAAPVGKRIGEIWFEPPAKLPDLLVKYIFTSEKLSVQVHPSDEQTLAAGIGKQGKEECWLVVDAEPGATLGVGFADEVESDAMREAALDGSIEDMLVWYEVIPGDFFYIPANTVHAIGAGCSIIEIQQNSDITYRLFDYGRPRELHLDNGMAVAKGAPHDPAYRKHFDTGDATMVEGPYFRLDRLEGAPSADVLERYEGPLLVIPLTGQVIVEGDPILPGQCALAHSLAEATFETDKSYLITQPYASE